MRYNDFCESKECPHMVQWEYYGKDLTSCDMVGESDDIECYPESCIHIDEIKNYREAPQ